MCGIFGFFDTNNSDIFYDLGKYSETRGKEASGFMNISKNNQTIYKFPLPFSDKKVGISIKKDQSKNASNSYIGHTRLKTHGNEEQDENNQPVFSEDISIVHNGIVVNYQKILKDFNIKISSELDSEIIVLLLDYYLKNSNINEALPQTIENLSGEVSIAGTYKKGEYFFLYTNTGSIYYVLNKNKLMYFSSEEWITKKIKSKYKIAGDIYKLEANNGLIFDSNYLKINNFFSPIVLIPLVLVALSSVLIDSIQRKSLLDDSFNHFITGIIGYFLAIVISLIPLEKIKKYILPIYFLSLISLIFGTGIISN